MKIIIHSITFLFTFYLTAQPNYIRTLGTYYGDDTMVIRDSAMDSNGNIVIFGNINITENTTQFTFSTSNAHQQTFAGGISDCFLAKFTPLGTILWATYFGGENEDRANNVSIDYLDNIILIGTTKSSTGIATLESFQPNLNGYTDQFISKFNTNGMLLWSTYFGANDTSDFPILDESSGTLGYSSTAINNNGEIFALIKNSLLTNMSTQGVFQEFNTHNNGSMIVKFNSTGERIWATYYGINLSHAYNIQCDNDGVYVLGQTNDCPPLELNSYFSSDSAFQPSPSSCADLFISKFHADHGTREWSTYYGGLSKEFLFKKSLKIHKNHLYIAGITSSLTNITTPNSYLPTKANGTTFFFSKFTTYGEQVWGTYYYDPSIGSIPSAMQHIGITAFDDYLYVFGKTEFATNFTTENSYQEIYSGGSDGFLLKFTTDGERDWATYFGGWSEDRVDNVLFKDDAIFLLGMTKSVQNISTQNGIQPTLLNYGDPNLGAPSNIFISKLEPNILSLQENKRNTVSVYPNPNNGSFTLVLPIESEAEIEVFDILGKKLLQQKVFTNQTISTNNWSKGIYLAKITSGNSIFETVKIVVE